MGNPNSGRGEKMLIAAAAVVVVVVVVVLRVSKDAYIFHHRHHDSVVGLSFPSALTMNLVNHQ